MRFEDRINNEYFDWMVDLVCGGDISYNKLLAYLHKMEFTFIIPLDQNRARDGIDLRWRFVYVNGYADDRDDILDCLDGPCSILEMMVALAIRCEEGIMDDPDIGDRTGQWFWGMVTNLGLGSMSDENFDRKYVDEVIERFLNREYDPDGRGGLFRVRNCKYDLREVEIFHQLCWYLDNIV